MCRDDLEIHARAVGGGSDDAGEGLVRNGADVDHGKIMLCESDVECIEGDAALRDNVPLVFVDLRGGGSVSMPVTVGDEDGARYLR